MARWYNGTGWTAHTVDKSTWKGNEQPPPPEREASYHYPDRDRHRRRHPWWVLPAAGAGGLVVGRILLSLFGV